jgi:hypothetical protein
MARADWTLLWFMGSEKVMEISWSNGTFVVEFLGLVEVTVGM